MATKKLLVTGATGKQGGALINALISSSTPTFEIYALTRNPSSDSSKRLSTKSPSIKVIEGNILNPAPIFEKTGPIYGVFGVTTFDTKDEEEQGKRLIDAALANGVQHFVFTSVDRGGPTKSDTNPTNIPHFISKHNIELYLKEKTAAGGKKMKWTILRPTAFFDNLEPGFMGKVFSTMWSQLKKPLQLVSCRDIGLCAAKTFQNPDKYSGKAITLAGDELNFEKGKEIFKQETGNDMPLTWGIFGTLLKIMVRELGTMFRWFDVEGYGCDIPALKREFPEIQDFATWLRDGSKFETLKK